MSEPSSRRVNATSLMSASALLLSGISFYETVVKQAPLDVYVPQVLHYARDGGGDTELFAVPITIANSGARTGTVVAMTLKARNNETGVEQRFYAAYFGDHPRAADQTPRAFAPLSIIGRSTFSDSIRFYPAGETRPYVLSDKGKVTFTLTLETVRPPSWDVLALLFAGSQPEVIFTRELPWFSMQQLGFRRIAIAMKEPSLSSAPPPAAPPAATTPVPPTPTTPQAN